MGHIYVHTHTGFIHMYTPTRDILVRQVADVLDKHMMLKLPNKIIESMNKRLDEIERTRAKMDEDIREISALHTLWETK
jgi:hypothetical protein